MSRLFFSALVLLVVCTYPRGADGQPQSETCAVCHLAMGVENLTKPAELYKADIHAAKGFGCVACHGGDGTIGGLESMDRKKGYIGKPTRAQVVEVCGRCHSDANFMRRYNPSLRVDQVSEYYTSVHGRRLREQKDEKVATCASCHKPHSIRPANDARSTVHPTHVAETCGSCHANKDYMAPYKIPTDQAREVQEERSLENDGEQRRSVGADLQRLSRQSRRGAAGSILGGQRLWAVPCG